MTRCSLSVLVGLVGLSAAVSSCGGDKVNKCLYRDPQKLTENEASKLPGAKLLPADTDFVLAGLNGSSASWARLTAAGALGIASSLVLTETPAIPPQLAITSRTTPGDQLVVVYGIVNAETQVEIHAVTQFPGEAASAPLTLKVLPKGLDVKAVRLAVGSSRTGLRALVAWGLVDQPGTKLEAFLLGANGAVVGSPLTFDAPDAWQCLQFVPSRTDWALSWLRLKPTTSGKPWFVIEEGKDVGTTVARFNIGLSTPEPGCPTVAPTPRGYAFAWQTMQGTYVTDYDISSSSVSGEFVAGAVRFGNPEDQPPIAGVASMGLDMAVTFGVKTGPQVWLFNPFGSHVGDDLNLPTSQPAVGPVSTWPLTNAFHATYREGLVDATGASVGPRWFMNVECPAN